MEDDAGVQTRLVPVGDRTIVVKKLTKIQMALMLRGTRVLRGNSSEDQKAEVVDEILDILESVVVSTEDKVFVKKAQVRGDIDLEDMVSWVAIFKDEDDDAAKKPTVRRGRARRS